jgi:hypothetical protein
MKRLLRTSQRYDVPSLVSFIIAFVALVVMALRRG